MSSRVLQFLWVLRKSWQCFMEARTKFNSESHDKTQLASLLKRYGGEDDLNWMGSKIFQQLYYGKLYAKKPVQGFSYHDAPNPNLDSALKRGDLNEAQLPSEGYPSCLQWWNRIKTDLVEVTNQSSVFNKHLNYFQTLERVRQYKFSHPNAWQADISAEDYMAKVLLSNSQDMQSNAIQNAMNNSNGMIASNVTHSLVNLGQWANSWTSTPLKRESIMQTLPVMQAFFTFFLIILTPLVLSLSNYSTKALGSLCALFMMSIFLQYLWHLVGFVERAVLDPLGNNDAIAAMRNMAVMFYFAGPVLLLKLSSYFGGEAGIGLMGLVNGAEDQSQELSNSGKIAARTGASIITGFIR
jgi:hypothetical protein